VRGLSREQKSTVQGDSLFLLVTGSLTGCTDIGFKTYRFNMNLQNKQVLCGDYVLFIGFMSGITKIDGDF
jgi:hypothetical protein